MALGSDAERMAARARMLIVIVLALFSVVIGRLAWMQVAWGEHYRRRAHERMQLRRTLEPKRGRILDRNDEPMVTNSVAYDLVASPGRVEPGSLAALAALLRRASARVEAAGDEANAVDRASAEQALGLDAPELARRMEALRLEALEWMEDDFQRRFSKVSERKQKRMRRSLSRYFLRRYYTLVEDVRLGEVVREVFCEPTRYVGIRVRSRPVRRRPHGDMGCHLLGYLNAIRAEEYREKSAQDYRPTDHIGRSGLERAYEDELRGRRGSEVRGRRLRGGQPNVLFREPALNGRDVATTLDRALQQVAEEALDQRLRELETEVPPKEGETRGGAVVLMDVESGAILALATAPRYDPATFSQRYKQLLADPDRPLFNRAVGRPRTPPPGSVFKVVTAIAGLEAGKCSPHTTHNCRGYLHEPGKFRCWRSSGHGTVALRGALESSCNIYFYKLGQQLGGEALAGWGRAFGFGQPTGLELPESRGTMPGPAWVMHRVGRRWQIADSRLVAIGQGLLETSPLQVARFCCGVATRGRLPRARLLRESPIEHTVVSARASTWRAIEEGMRAVVETGTASRYGLQAFELAAKTGTAETARNRETHAWIAGYAPASQPRVAIAVMVEHSGHGGEVTGPIARKVLAAYFGVDESHPEDGAR